MEHQADLKICLAGHNWGEGAERRANTGEREVNGDEGRIGVVLHGRGGGTYSFRRGEHQLQLLGVDTEYWKRVRGGGVNVVYSHAHEWRLFALIMKFGSPLKVGGREGGGVLDPTMASRPFLAKRQSLITQIQKYTVSRAPSFQPRQTNID